MPAPAPAVPAPAVPAPAVPAPAVPAPAVPAPAVPAPAVPAPAATEPQPASEPEPIPSAQGSAPAQADATPPERVATGRAPRPRPRPRPRPVDAAAADQPTAPATRDGAADDAPAERAGFGPTSATGTPAPPHALFTPAPKSGPGAAPGPGGAAPGPEFTIKGNADSMLFHTPDSPYFERTRAEVWFRTADEAVAAGFTEWRAHRRTS